MQKLDKAIPFLTSAMRVLNCILDNRFGGPHRRNLMIAEHLSKQDIETIFLIGAKSNEQFMPEMFACYSLRHLQCFTRARPLFSVFTFLVFLLANILAVCRIIKRQRIDIVHINGLMNIVPALAAALMRKPVLWHCNDGGLPNIIVKAYLPCITFLSDKCIVQGSKIGNQLFGNRRRLWKKTVTTYPPVNTKQFCRDTVNPDKVLQFQKQLNLNPDCILVGSVGNINPCKGFEHFISAAAMVRKQFENTRFLIVGKILDTQQAYYDSLRKLVAALKLEDAVIFTDFTEAIPELFSVMDLYVLSSVRESCPNVVLEALSMEVPIAATNVGSVAELLDLDEASSLVKPGDPVALARRMLEILETPKKDMASHTSRGRKRAENLFDIATISDKQCHIYKELLQLHSTKQTYEK